MIVQACINGARDAVYHPALPLTPDAMARDSAACVAAGAAEVHLHARGPDGRESLSPAAIDATVSAVRQACPGALIGVSTGAWIERNEERTLEAIDGWRQLPDFASVNLAEPDAPAVIAHLRRRGVGVEAGIASVADAERLATLNLGRFAFRLLIEVSEQDVDEALSVVEGVEKTLNRAGVRRPTLVHGFDATVWRFVALAAARRWSTRVGLEDGKALPGGATAADNAALVAAAAAAFRKQGRP